MSAGGFWLGWCLSVLAVGFAGHELSPCVSERERRREGKEGIRDAAQRSLLRREVEVYLEESKRVLGARRGCVLPRGGRASEHGGGRMWCLS